MDCLLELPQPVIFKTYVLDVLQSNNLVSSPAILNNLHSIIYVALFYHMWFLIAKYIIFPPFVKLKMQWDQEEEKNTSAKTRKHKLHKHQSPKKRYNSLVIQCSIHFISLLQCVFVLYPSLSILLNPAKSSEIFYDSEARVFGTTRDTEVVCIFAIGYFLWDSVISMFYSSIAFVLHGIVSAAVYFIGLKPYIQYYAPVFMMFELSNPFLNFRWFGIKLLPSNNKFIDYLLLFNNLLLMIIFFLARIVYGWFQIGMIVYDYYTVRNDPRFILFDSVVIVGGNLILDVLNAIWLSTMVKVAIKLLKGEKKADKKD